MGIKGQYLVSQTQPIKARLRIPIGLIQSSMSKDQIADTLRIQHYQEIRKVVASWDDDRLGKVIGDAEKVFSKCNLDLLSLTGRGILMDLAMTAVIYSIAVLVWDEVQKAKEEEAKPALAKVDDHARFKRMFEEGVCFIDYFRNRVGGHWYYQSIECQALRLTVRCRFRISSREENDRIEQLKIDAASWISKEKELTIVLEVVEDMGSSKKEGAVLFTCTCGPTLQAQIQ